jgi:cytochrome b561
MDSSRMTVSRYHPALVVLHWLLALMLMAALAMGSLVLEKLPNTDPEKITALRGHMIAGGLVALLMLARLVVRWTTARPPALRTGIGWADRLSGPVHALLYALVFLMAASGIAMSISAGLPQAVFLGQGVLPSSFDGMAPRAVHGLIAKLLMLAIALHIGAALFHAVARRDGIMARMWLGRR